MAKLASVIRTATDALESYEHSKALEAIETFFWEFCDDYIELAKNRAYGTAESTGRTPSEAAVKSARTTLGLALDALARLLAPYLPYATEEVWSWMHDGEGCRCIVLAGHALRRMSLLQTEFLQTLWLTRVKLWLLCARLSLKQKFL